MIIRYPLSEIKIFNKTKNTFEEIGVIGETQRSKPGYPKARSHFFNLKKIPKIENLILTVKSLTSMNVPIEFQTNEDLVASREIETWTIAVQYGALIMIILAIFIIGYAMTNSTYISLSWLSLSMFCALASLNWIPQTFFPINIEALSIRILPISGFFLFFQNFIFYTKIANIEIKNLNVKLASMILLVALATVLLSYQKLMFLVHFALFGSLIYSAYSCLKIVVLQKQSLFRTYAFVPLFGMFGMSIISLKALGFIKSNTFINYSPQVGITVSIVIILIVSIRDALQFKKDHSVQIYELRKLEAITDHAKQVAHDIRSPLAALKFIEKSITNENVELQKNLLSKSISKITDISGELLNHNKTSLLENKIDILELVNDVVTEKQNVEKIQTTIHITANNYDSKVTSTYAIRKIDLNRIISNIVQNGIEAMNFSGKINLEIKDFPTQTEIKITDCGPGIPRQILLKLGQKGVTYGKTNGNGIGLYHAKNTIESHNGIFSVFSVEKQGTCVSIVLNKIALNEHCPSSLVLSPAQVT